LFEEEDNNIHKQVASILKGDLQVGGILSLETKSMVPKTLDYVDLLV